jgi:hypothetical protein
MERENWRNWRWERESCDELEITGVENSDRAAGREAEEARGAEVSGSEVVAARWAWEHVVQRVLDYCLCRCYCC